MRAAVLVVCVALLVFLTADKIAARDTDKHEVRARDRVIGYGQIRFRGLGPEKWAQKYRQERMLRQRLENLLEHRARVRHLQATGTPTVTVNYAYRLASAVTGVPLGQLRAVAWCESRHWVFARNGAYRGLFQEGPMFERGPLGRAGFSPFDPIANAMTAALTVVADGSWRQWTCKP